jgi:hypothetical protein
MITVIGSQFCPIYHDPQCNVSKTERQNLLTKNIITGGQEWDLNLSVILTGSTARMRVQTYAPDTSPTLREGSMDRRPR